MPCLDEVTPCGRCRGHSPVGPDVGAEGGPPAGRRAKELHRQDPGCSAPRGHHDARPPHGRTRARAERQDDGQATQQAGQGKVGLGRHGDRATGARAGNRGFPRRQARHEGPARFTGTKKTAAKKSLHQIEHPLLPDLPSNRYAEIAPRVRELFEHYGLTHHAASLPTQVASARHKVLRRSLPNGWLADTTPRNIGRQHAQEVRVPAVA